MVPALDAIVMTSKECLTLIYTHRSPVSITGPDAYSLYLFLVSKSTLTYPEYERSLVTDLEVTQGAA